MLIRINNEIRFELFGELTAPQVVRGANGQLIERSYLEEYCARTEGMGATLRRRHHSEAARYPELLSRPWRRFCLCGFAVEGSASAGIFRRPGALPEHGGGAGAIGSAICRTRCKQAGIDVVDTAGLIHSLKGHYEVELFPQGGVHWNDIGGAHAAVAAVVEEINRQTGRELVPPFTFTYTLSSVDQRRRPRPCRSAQRVFSAAGLSDAEGEIRSRRLRAPIAGAVDSTPPWSAAASATCPAEILVEDNCLSGLNVYYYMRRARPLRRASLPRTAEEPAGKPTWSACATPRS